MFANLNIYVLRGFLLFFFCCVFFALSWYVLDRSFLYLCIMCLCLYRSNENDYLKKNYCKLVLVFMSSIIACIFGVCIGGIVVKQENFIAFISHHSLVNIVFSQFLCRFSYLVLLLFCWPFVHRMECVLCSI